MLMCVVWLGEEHRGKIRTNVFFQEKRRNHETPAKGSVEKNRRCRGEVGVRTRLWESAEERRRGQQTVGRRTASEVFQPVWPKVEGGPTGGHVPPDVGVCRIDQTLPRRRFRGELICV